MWFKKNLGLIVIIILGFIPLLNLFHQGLPLTHDGQDHVARIANFYQNILEGNLVPRWGANLNWGYGHPILMFLYPLPSYAASLFYFFGFTFVDSVKLVFGISFILSGVCMYFWIRNILGEHAGILSGVLYMYAPYRFVDFYVRGAIGEHVAFLFGPLVLYFVYKASIDNHKKITKWFLFVSLSIAGLLLSHNAIAIMFLPVIILYAGILIYKSKNREYLSLYYLLAILIGFGFSAFFIVPAYFEGKYTLRDIVTGSGEYKSGFVSFKDFFIPSWSYGGSQLLSKQIGVIQIFLMVLTLFSFKKIKKNKNFLLFVVCLFIFTISLFMMTSSSDFIWQKVTLLQKFQFPWRLLSPVVLVTSVISSFAIFLVNNKKIKTAIVGVACAACVIFYFPYYQPNGYLVKPQSFFTGVYYGTTDTGESSPKWSVRFMEHTASKSAEFIDGFGTITPVMKNSTQRVYAITVKSITARIRENTLYFPNWQVYVNGATVPVEFQDRLNRGLITYYLKQGENDVRIKFEDTKLRIISNIISILSISALVVSFLYIAVKHEK